jgi:hypothetical protein
MAITKMTRGSKSSYTEAFYEFSETLTSAANGDTYYCDEPGQFTQLTVTYTISAGSGYIQTTTSKYDDVIAGNAKWLTWDFGTVTATTGVVFANVTAIRQVNVSGSTTIEGRLV